MLALVTACHEDATSPTAQDTQPAIASVQAPLAFQQAITGFFHSCGVTTAGVGYCWGDNRWGQLGDGTTGTRLLPTRLSGTLTFRQVSMGAGRTCGVTRADLAYCWGESYGPAPVALPGGVHFQRVSVGDGGGCGVTTEDRVFCWGMNDRGQLGDGTTTNRSSPRAVAGGRRYRQVSSNSISACAITLDDVLFCWGWNENGQLGDGTTINRSVPTRIKAGDLRFRQVTTALWHTCAVTTIGVPYCWGLNEYGRLGNGTFYQSSPVPGKVHGGLRFRSVTAGAYHTCGLTPENAAYCWGRGGDLGRGTLENSRLPVPVAGTLHFRQLDADVQHTCGVTTSNMGYCWGVGADGQLGTGATTFSLTPVAVAGPL